MGLVNRCWDLSWTTNFQVDKETALQFLEMRDSDITKNKYLIFVPDPWHTILKTLESLEWKEYLLHTDEMTGSWGLLDSFSIGFSCQKAKAGLEDLNFKPYLPLSPESQDGLETELLANGQWFNQLYLYTETSKKSLNCRFRDHRVVHPRKGMEAPHTSHTLIPCPVYLFHLAVPELYPLK